MSFNGFFPGAGDDPADQTPPAPQDNYQTFAPRTTRGQSQLTIGNVLANSSASPYPSRPTWASASVNYSGDIAFYHDHSANSHYYTLSSALSHANAASSYPESHNAYVPSPIQISKIEIPASYQQLSNFPQYQSSSYTQYQPSYPDPTEGMPHYHAHEAPNNNEIILLDPEDISRRGSVDIKEEPRTPSSPQFIFEFPGADDDLPPFELPPLTAASLSHDSGTFSHSISSPRTRPSSPATEAMKSMMSVFRVDPFASYDITIDSGPARNRKRRKRASTYARMTDPEASSKEPPLIFTFQLDVWGADFDGDDGASAMDDLDTTLYALDSDTRNEYYEGFDTDVGSYRHSSDSGGFNSAGIIPLSPSIHMSMPIPLPLQSSGGGGGGEPGLFTQEHTSAVEFLLRDPFDAAASNDLSADSSQASTSTHYGSRSLIYPSSDSSRSSPIPSLLEEDASSLSMDGVTSSTALTSKRDREGDRPRVQAKMHICWICHKEFPRPSGLATHMNTHSGARPYKCPIAACAKSFAVRSNARRHLRTHTGIESAAPPSRHSESPPLEGDSESESGARHASVGVSRDSLADSTSPRSSYVPGSVAVRSNTSRLSPSPPFTYEEAQVPVAAPAESGSDSKGDSEDRTLLTDHSLQFPYHPLQFRSLPAARSIYASSAGNLSVSSLVALEAC